MHFKTALCILMLVPALAAADHACLDGYPMGTPLKLEHPMPEAWFRAGISDVRKEATYSALKQRYGKDYVSDYDEGPVGSLCVKLKVGYVAVTTSDFGPGVEYSVFPPKCLKCSSINVAEKEFVSGTGLRLGLTKAQTSELLKAKITADLTDVMFEEMETSGTRKVLHTEVLLLEFKNDRLIRFSAHDYREGA